MLFRLFPSFILDAIQMESFVVHFSSFIQVIRMTFCIHLLNDNNIALWFLLLFSSSHIFINNYSTNRCENCNHCIVYSWQNWNGCVLLCVVKGQNHVLSEYHMIAYYFWCFEHYLQLWNNSRFEVEHFWKQLPMLAIWW